MKKYLWLLLPVIVFVAVVVYCYFTLKPTPTVKKTTAAISKIEQTVMSQDKAVERVYSGVKKEVSVKNAEIQRTVKVLSPDVVALSLDALLSEYRRERGS